MSVDRYHFGASRAYSAPAIAKATVTVAIRFWTWRDRRNARSMEGGWDVGGVICAG